MALAFFKLLLTSPVVDFARLFVT